MPSDKGKTGKPGNDTSYRNIGISTSKPELLQPGKSKGNKSPESVLGGKSSGKKSSSY